MPSLDILTSAAKTLYQQAEKYKDNENRIKILTDEIKSITDIVWSRESEFFDKNGEPKEDENIKPALQDLYQSIKDALELITEFDTVHAKNLDKTWQFIKKFIQANGYEQRIIKIHDRLKSCETRLSLGIALKELKNNKKYEEARRADAKLVQSQLEIIKTQVEKRDKTGEITGELVTQMMDKLKILQQSFDAKPVPVTHSTVVEKTDKFISAHVGRQGGGGVEFSDSVDPVLAKLFLENRKSEASDLAVGLGELDPSLTSMRYYSTHFTVQEAKIIEKFDKAHAGGDKISVAAEPTISRERHQVAVEGMSSAEVIPSKYLVDSPVSSVSLSIDFSSGAQKYAENIYRPTPSESLASSAITDVPSPIPFNSGAKKHTEKGYIPSAHDSSIPTESAAFFRSAPVKYSMASPERHLEKWCIVNNIKRKLIKLHIVENEISLSSSRILSTTDFAHKLTMKDKGFKRYETAKISIEFPLDLTEIKTREIPLSIPEIGEININLNAEKQEARYTQILTWGKIGLFYEKSILKPKIFIEKQSRIAYFESEILISLEKAEGARVGSIIDIFKPLLNKENTLYQKQEEQVCFKVFGKIEYYYYDYSFDRNEEQTAAIPTARSTQTV